MLRILHGLIPSLESLVIARDEIRQTNDEVHFCWLSVMGVISRTMVPEMLIDSIRDNQDSILRMKNWSLFW
jgi:hypothetical protein